MPRTKPVIVFGFIVPALVTASLTGTAVRAQQLLEVATGKASGDSRAEGLPSDPPAEARRVDEANVSDVLQLAREGYERIQRDIRDYSCVLVKRERVDGRLREYEYMYAKVRHARVDADGRRVPFSVYLRFYGPADLKGREVLYVEGRDDGKMLARRGGLRFAYITTMIEPDSDLAMKDNRHPITEFGIENLVKRFVHVAEEQAVWQDSTIRTWRGAKVDGRPCRCIQVTKQRSSDDADPEFCLARVFVDEQLQVPIHYEAFDWPAEEGGAPQLLEQYTYRDLKLNVGLTDADFVRDNPAYGFSASPRE